MSHEKVREFVVWARLAWLGNESTHSQPNLTRGAVKMKGYKTYLSVERDNGHRLGTEGHESRRMTEEIPTLKFLICHPQKLRIQRLVQP